MTTFQATTPKDDKSINAMQTKEKSVVKLLEHSIVKRGNLSSNNEFSANPENSGYLPRALLHLANSAQVTFNGFELDSKVNRQHTKKTLMTLEKNNFLRLINLIVTDVVSGFSPGLALPMPSVIDTSQHAREPENNYFTQPKPFECQQINFDYQLTYSKLDYLAAYYDRDLIAEALSNLLYRYIFNGLLMIGFNGKQRNSLKSDSRTNPKGEDVAKGWLQKLREEKGNNVIASAAIGKSQDYANIHQVIKAMLAKIPEPLRSSNLIAICGRNALPDVEFDSDWEDFSAENNALFTLSRRTIGGLKAIIIPCFPAASVLVTRLDNLTLYLHHPSIKKTLEEVPARNLINNYTSLRADFVLEDANAAVLVENLIYS
ncbi:phage major capsid protein, P2 family [Pasteurellaceae bacterium TAE3-ERU1]|nr:phage major capsid protein, P2 family [Pasteurellaceae bacterium TAE3-ERU1]